MRILQRIQTYRWDALQIMLILLEAGFLFYFYHEKRLDITYNELGFTLCSIMIGIVILIKYYGKQLQVVPSNVGKSHHLLRLIVLLCIAVTIAEFAINAASIFRHIPINPHNSDIIPLIQTAVERLLNGETVYATIDKWGYQMPLTYLPMQWMPYIISAIAGFDYRWITVSVFCLAFIIVTLRCSRVSFWYSLIVCGLVHYFCRMLITYDTGILSMTVELMVAGYYMLLIMGISGRNPWLRGAFIAVCLLSRYSLILWLPLWIFIELSTGSKKDFFRSCGIAVSMVLLVYIIPFLSHDWSAFARGYHYYTQATLAQWSNDGNEGISAQLNNGVGFARLFYLKLWHYTVPDRLKSLQKVHFVVCLGSTVIMGLLYWITRRRIHPRIFTMASFKIYLGLFLAFIQLPYPYLMITSIAVSIAIFAEMPRYRIVPFSAAA